MKVRQLGSVLDVIDYFWARFDQEPWLHALMLRGLAGKALRVIALESIDLPVRRGGDPESPTLDKLRAQGSTAAMTAEERTTDLQRHAALWSRVATAAVSRNR